ncbi:MAG: prepilin-type N-terminal cleavage/methylation domain-containing protein [Phycisphaeraceae bacterium]|nr:prepilin-type N-terminal cleavage/methylation domain-containing protein [Phycisphaeraceae bacterium]
MTRAHRRMLSRHTRGFSLIEVLIAVLILGLGLLGLGAVFPVVVREQRIGTETTFGVLAAQSARDQLEQLASNPPIQGTGPNTGKTLWQILRDDTNQLVMPLNASDIRGEWKPLSVVPDTGMVQVPDPPNANVPSFHISMAERLYPRDPGNGIEPQFVWDIAVQRVPDMDEIPWQASFVDGYLNDSLRFAIFVRRLDPRIRLPEAATDAFGQPLTLFAALTQRIGLSQQNQRVPVGEDPTTGIPTQDGLGATGAPTYCPIKTLAVEYRYTQGHPVLGRRDRLYLDTGVNQTQINELWNYARLPNQKLIDNLGSIYTVLENGADADGRQWVRITPEVPAAIPATSPGAANRPEIRQIVFTQQVPAAVVTWTLVP